MFWDLRDKRAFMSKLSSISHSMFDFGFLKFNIKFSFLRLINIYSSIQRFNFKIQFLTSIISIFPNPYFYLTKYTLFSFKRKSNLLHIMKFDTPM